MNFSGDLAKHGLTALVKLATGHIELIHCGVVTPYGIGLLGQQWFGNGLFPDGNKPLPEPVLTYYQWDSLAYIPG